MKNALKTIATIAVAATMTLAGCEKIDDVVPIVPSTPEEEPIENIFDGTAWVAHMENTYYYEGIQMDLTLDLSLDFLDTVNAEILNDLLVYLPAYPTASQRESMTETFTYTYTKDSVFLVGISYGEEGDTIGEYCLGMAYDKEANTLTVDYNDEDLLDMMGSDIVVFTPRDMGVAKTTVVRSNTVSDRSKWQKLMEAIALNLGE